MISKMTRYMLRHQGRIPTAPRDLHPHCIFYSPLEANLRDYISGQYASFARAGSLTYLNKNGIYQTAGVDRPAFGKYGLFHDGAGTNTCTNSRNFGAWLGDASVVQDQTGIDGQSNTAWTISDNNATDILNIVETYTVADDNSTHTASIFVKKDNDESRFPLFRMRLSGGSTGFYHDLHINTKTGAINENLDDNNDDYYVVSSGDWWRVVNTITNNGSGNTELIVRYYPASGTVFGTNDASATGSSVIDWAQVELNSKIATSPIYTNGSTVSRATQAADSGGNGVQWELSKLDPRVLTSLGSGGNGVGTVILETRPEHPDNININKGLVTVRDDLASILYWVGGNTLRTFDGANFASDSFNFISGDKIQIAVRWAGSTLELLREKTGDLSWTINSDSFDGSFAIGTHLRLMFGNEYTGWMSHISMYDKDLSLSEINRELRR